MVMDISISKAITYPMEMVMVMVMDIPVLDQFALFFVLATTVPF